MVSTIARESTAPPMSNGVRQRHMPTRHPSLTSAVFLGSNFALRRLEKQSQ
jgi:hypothetical protein